MILEFLSDYLTGKKWEEMIDYCYRDRYQSVNYTKVPSIHLGDGGIEGFTMNGIVYQCYCPEKQYTDEALYGALRKKVTKDINKFIDLEYAKVISSLGIKKVNEWHFVVPEYRDKRIIQHLEKKRGEVIAAKLKDPEKLSYIDDEIVLTIKVAEDFKLELVRLIKNPLVDIKLNTAVKEIIEIDWDKCDTEKLNNIRKKIKTLLNDDDESEDYAEMVKYWSEAYIKGIEIMTMLQENFAPIYEELYYLEQEYKKDVKMKSIMNKNHIVSNDLFNQVLDDFEKTLTTEFHYFSKTTVIELKRDLVGGWLADCSLKFKTGGIL